jgi:hypothetical protein
MVNVAATANAKNQDRNIMAQDVGIEIGHAATTPFGSAGENNPVNKPAIRIWFLGIIKKAKLEIGLDIDQRNIVNKIVINM